MYAIRKHHVLGTAGLLLIIAAIVIFCNAHALLQKMTGTTVLNDFMLWMLCCTSFGTGIALLGEAESAANPVADASIYDDRYDVATLLMADYSTLNSVQRELLHAYEDRMLAENMCKICAEPGADYADNYCEGCRSQLMA
jgi:hypothetical protein